MVRERTGEQLDAWLGAVQASHLKAFQSFVTGVQQDKDAVLAGLTLPWSNGPLEGNVNRLKLIKRSMYGRAEFDLLKLRVLYQSKKNRDRKNKKTSSTTGGSSEETEEHEKQRKLSAYHNWDQQGCVSFISCPTRTNWLANHTEIEAKIQMPEDWKDPSPDM